MRPRLAAGRECRWPLPAVRVAASPPTLCAHTFAKLAASHVHVHVQYVTSTCDDWRVVEMEMTVAGGEPEQQQERGHVTRTRLLSEGRMEGAAHSAGTGAAASISTTSPSCLCRSARRHCVAFRCRRRLSNSGRRHLAERKALKGVGGVPHALHRRHAREHGLPEFAHAAGRRVAHLLQRPRNLLRPLVAQVDLLARAVDCGREAGKKQREEWGVEEGDRLCGVLPAGAERAVRRGDTHGSARRGAGACRPRASRQS